MSVYLPSLDALFVHVPRCGGTWVKECLHASDVAIEPAKGAGTHNLPEKYGGGGFRFCFFRHPISWIVSAWRGFHSGWPTELQGTPGLYNGGTFSPFRVLSRHCGRRDFNDFIKAILDYEPGFVSRMYEWYAGPPGAPKMQAVGQNEKSADHLGTILRKAGFSGVLQLSRRANVGDREFPTWDSNLVEKFAESEKLGIARFYRNEGPYFVET